MNTPDGQVSAAEWQNYLREVVTPFFPDGFTVFESSGQWRGPDQQIIQEPSRVIEIVHSADASKTEQVHEIAKAYKIRFRQDAVMIVKQKSQVCFE